MTLTDEAASYAMDAQTLQALRNMGNEFEAAAMAPKTRVSACATDGRRTKMTTWADEYVTLLEDCEKRSERLSDWELGFVDSLQRQLAEGRRPSAKQIETLDTIWERATKRG